jgi:D-lactate dehydrogenase (quinone)
MDHRFPDYVRYRKSSSARSQIPIRYPNNPRPRPRATQVQCEPHDAENYYTAGMLARRFVRCRKGSFPFRTARWNTSSFATARPTPPPPPSLQSSLPSQQESKFPSQRSTIPVVLASLAAGFFLGRQSVPSHDDDVDHRHLPNGMPRTCCEPTAITEDQKDLFRTLKRIVGKQNVLDGREDTTLTLPFLKGARLGKGSALYIVKPQKLKEVVEVAQAVVDANCVLLVQGSNTGLTGGSVPRPQADGRPTILVSMKDLDTIVPIDNGERVVCLAGVGLASLQNFVHEHFHRESHSILGSTFLNPTTAAGISLGSGGTQMRKGPAYTERALYLKVLPDKFGKPTVRVVNTLGIKDLDLEEGEFDAHLGHDGIVRTLDKYVASIKAGPNNKLWKMKRSNETYGTKPASDTEYKRRLCQQSSANNDSKAVNRYNADTRGPECNRSEGKVIILASVHDTFPKPTNAKTFWISFDTFETALQFRRQVCLDNPDDVPISMEYLDRDSFDVIDQAGRVLGNTIYAVGPSSPIVRNLWNLKIWIESLNVRGASSKYYPARVTPKFLSQSTLMFRPMLPCCSRR